ncbi:mannosyltransferase 1 (CAP59) [Hydromonas duriensis]|uniref:Mannosyltransferase 1 (CAP59) n=2 Tax=Hydromonas duriensis TaxID=1527608 RepID=A0A4V3DJN8_9BURK|nr:mannosyltransferase 1 (CAP59) [Hydromonas duriensis]
MRNRADMLLLWYQQLQQLVAHDIENEYFLSVYENDSTDNSKQLLAELDFSFFNDVTVQSENINTDFFGSVIDKQRVINLANARNKCIYGSPHYAFMDKILFIEMGVSYDIKQAINCIQNSTDYDILSGISVITPLALEALNTTPALLVTIYDQWATRFSPNSFWEEKVIVKKDYYQMVWSTFNCFCVYNAEPFKAGITFGWKNARVQNLNFAHTQPQTGQPTAEQYFADCDTAVVCENFQHHHYSKIAIDTNFIVLHHS